MKNKLFMALALFCGLVFSGCGNGVQDVRIVSDKAPAVAGVSAVLTDDEKYIIVSWDAVDDVGGYTVYVKGSNSKEILFGYLPQNEHIYNPSNGSYVQLCLKFCEIFTKKCLTLKIR
jgi:fibronectin type 3 domain-containing protein